ncbi:MAG TPA: peptide chain release factor 1 [Kiritimatiellia bacterium]|nr:peptide chain release factor 1 [Kiritimatiellia bacterium]
MLDHAYIERIASRLQELERELSLPETSAQPAIYRDRVREHQRLQDILAKGRATLSLKDRLNEARELKDHHDTDPDLRTMAIEEIKSIESQLPEAERQAMIALIPPDPDDSRNTIVEIRAGTGGEEAALFAADLYRMYQRYAESRGWTIRLIDVSYAGQGGFKEIVFQVEGEDVYRTLRYESGGHRVQRIPVTEAGGRIHTSAATVAVLPEAEEIDDVNIRPEDIRIDLYRASGPGGQKVNKTESAVRITHLPTGIVAQSQDERSQHSNRDRAMVVLKTRILDKIRSEDAASKASERKSQVGSGDRSERIRTYNFPQNRVTDHRINLTLYNLSQIIEGDLSELVSALQDRHIQEKLAAIFQHGA